VDRDVHELARALMPVRRVAVVGGGWAGLAAAVEATLRGHAVTLFEMAPQWGGRARRVDIDGLSLDNGQHIMIGAYRETLRLMRSVGVDIDAAFVRSPLRLVQPDGHGLQLPPGTPVVAFARGVIALRGWPQRHRLALLAAAGGWALRGFGCSEALTVAQLTAGLPALVRGELIDPLCVAALNTPADSASARVFLRVVRDALFSGPGSADLLLPRQRLSALLPEPAAQWLAAHGAKLQLGTRVEQLARTGGGWSVDGAPFDAVILATTAVEAARLARPIAPDWAAAAASLHYEPIVTVYAQSTGTRLSEPMLALHSDARLRPAQFVFDHGQLGGQPGLLAFVISGAQPWLDRGIAFTRDATLAQGHDLLAAQLRAPLQAVRVLTEKRATFRCVPAMRRPAAAIAAHLHAAGDYVAGPYPATIEGAVRSAIEAVQRLGNGAASGSPMNTP
jgi:squalene-associated FAD-dependent desaturase